LKVDGFSHVPFALFAPLCGDFSVPPITPVQELNESCVIRVIHG
jgi:hypothetical protein